MGVHGFWKWLEEEQLVYEASGYASHEAVAKEIEGLVLAVDLSLWLCQAIKQEKMTAPPRTRCVRLVVSRVVNLMRYGVVPVLVLEGSSPKAKQPLKNKRNQRLYGKEVGGGSGGGGGSGKDSDSDVHVYASDVKQVMVHMGVKCVEAPGEAEAMCAALEAEGLVDGCLTADVDVLQFGARRVYKELHLSTVRPGETRLVRCNTTELQARLGLEKGLNWALIAAFNLSGGDYNMQGVELIGVMKAMRTVRLLAKTLEGPQSECTGRQVLEELRARMQEEPSAMPKNPKRTREKSSEEENDARDLDLVLNRIRASKEGFVERYDATCAAYAEEIEAAAKAAQRERTQLGTDKKFQWQQRPDVSGMHHALHRIEVPWTWEKVQRTLLPLLLEWDAVASHGLPAPAGRASPTTPTSCSASNKATKVVQEESGVIDLTGDESDSGIPPAELDMSDVPPNEYEVDRIVNHVYEGPGSTPEEFFVSWKGYSSKDNTWEPVENLKNSMVELNRYKKSVSERQADGGIEYRPVAIAKGHREHCSHSGVTMKNWRFLVQWERIDGGVDNMLKEKGGEASELRKVRRTLVRTWHPALVAEYEAFKEQAAAKLKRKQGKLLQEPPGTHPGTIDYYMMRPRRTPRSVSSSGEASSVAGATSTKQPLAVVKDEKASGAKRQRVQPPLGPDQTSLDAFFPARRAGSVAHAAGTAKREDAGPTRGAAAADPSLLSDVKAISSDVEEVPSRRSPQREGPVPYVMKDDPARIANWTTLSLLSDSDSDS